MRSLRAAALAMLFLIALLPVARLAGASQVQLLDTRELTLGSSEVVIGEVRSVHSHWNDAHTKIVTDVEVAISRTLKGAPAERVTLTQLGGTVGNLRVDVDGSPAFLPGEEAVFFVWRDSQGRAQLKGLGQGKFEIHRDAANGHKRVQRSTEGLAVHEARALRPSTSTYPSPGVPLDELIIEIEAAVKEGGR